MNAKGSSAIPCMAAVNPPSGRDMSRLSMITWDGLALPVIVTPKRTESTNPEPRKTSDNPPLSNTPHSAGHDSGACRAGPALRGVSGSALCPLPSDLRFVGQQTQEAPAKADVAGTDGAVLVSHLDEVDRPALGGARPGKRPLGLHPVLTAQQLKAMVGGPPLRQVITRLAHSTSFQRVCRLRRGTQAADNRSEGEDSVGSPCPDFPLPPEPVAA